MIHKLNYHDKWLKSHYELPDCHAGFVLLRFYAADNVGEPRGRISPAGLFCLCVCVCLFVGGGARGW